MKDVFKLILTAIRQTKRSFKNGAEVGSLWKSTEWDALLEQLTGSEKYGRATGLHAMCKQVRDLTHVSKEVVPRREKPSKSKAKRKAEDVEAPLEKPQKPKKKKTKVVAEN